MTNYAGSALMLVVTTAVIVGSYTVNLKVSAERGAVEKLRRQLVVDARTMRDLQAELRTRARLPQMQRWNDDVLLMSAPSAGQYLRNPVQLASFAMPEASVASVSQVPGEAGAMTATRAVTAPAPAAVRTLDAPVQRAAYRAAPATAAPAYAASRVVAAAYHPAKPPTPPTLEIIAEPLALAPPPQQDRLPDGGQ